MIDDAVGHYLDGDDWSAFRVDLRHQMDRMGVDDTDVAYVRLDDAYWMNIEDFFDLYEPPHVWRGVFALDQYRIWHLPPRFRVVMCDSSWLEYEQHIDDPFLNRWLVHESNRRPPRHYRHHQSPLEY
jgi:hypothetical protein